jgi:hypothetical protein
VGQLAVCSEGASDIEQDSPPGDEGGDRLDAGDLVTFTGDHPGGTPVLAADDV